MSKRPSLPDFFRLTQLARIDSTSEEAKRLARAGCPEGTLVMANEQTAGHGRQGRAWVSPPGNFYASLVLRPDCAAAAAAQLSFAACLAVGEACLGFLPKSANLAYKWPNDVLLGDRKAAGLLLEAEAAGDARPRFVVLGIGVNLVSYPKEADFPATSLAAAGVGGVTPDSLLEALAPALLIWYERWRDSGFASLRSKWLERASGLGETIRVRLPREELTGIFSGLDQDGALLLESGGKKRRIAAAEVFPAA
ncbi:MAG TPA: biotin--[acetyl-CoA-carboxylase] ligase [Stellaceae bacterium]|nr:biotin--[acetyl-CoA-carboxylase] ligase [Stellaceae bacterium]